MRNTTFLSIAFVALLLAGCRAGSSIQILADTPTPVPTATLPPPATQPTESPTLVSTPLPQTAPESILQSITIRPVLLVDGLDQPVGIVSAGDGSNRLFILERIGRIRIVQDRVLLPTPFLNIQDRVGSASREQGLLGLAFSPSYATNGQFFVNYTNQEGDTVIARFEVSHDPNIADPTSQQGVLFFEQPAVNHNGGNLVFGPDGYLYIGTGDGGLADDPFGNGQKIDTVLGKMLRIDVSTLPYSIPPDNPYVSISGRDEIWAIGLRNPWRYSFDRETGDLYIADVGQDTFEEVNFIPAGTGIGSNFGWNRMEGIHCFPPNRAVCNTDGLSLPVVEYSHQEGCSITGGYVYRGQQYPVLNGTYLFGDFCSGLLWGTSRNVDGTWGRVLLAETGLLISSFGEDEAGEIYIADMQGAVYQLTVGDFDE